MDMLDSRLWTGRTPSGASREYPVRSRTPKKAKAPPRPMITRATQSVPYCPKMGSTALENSDPNVGRPPVNAK